MQWQLSDGVEPQEKRLGYLRAVAKGYMSACQYEKAVDALQMLLDNETDKEGHLECLCNLADAQVLGVKLHTIA
jgi:hypothetical protein